MTRTALALWLSTGDAAERSAALDDLITAGDLSLITTDSDVHLVRRHRDIVTRYETGGLPALSAADA
jgi:hypothetical protein